MMGDLLETVEARSLPFIGGAASPTLPRLSSRRVSRATERGVIPIPVVNRNKTRPPPARAKGLVAEMWM
jgi:hypothetical protein